MAAVAYVLHQKIYIFNLLIFRFILALRIFYRNQKPKMTDKMSYQAGQAKGQTQEKASNLMDKAGNAAQSAKETVQAKTETSKMPGNTQKTNFQAGEAKGQTQEKASTLMDKAGNAAQSAKETVTAAGQQVMATAQGAVEGVKNATGMNK